MLYQKLLAGERPYVINISCLNGFENHRHTEVELNYCIEGSYSVRLGQQLHRMQPGDLLLIGSMASHEFPACGGHNLALTIEMGPVLLGSYFAALKKIPLLRLSTGQHPTLQALLAEIVALQRAPTAFSELQLKGSLYRLCACILGIMEQTQPTEPAVKALRSVANIEKALELIYTGYAGALSVEEVARLCGYSKSNFCKTFKTITGDTFHSVLNRYRVKIASNLLKNTDHPLEQIADEVGFGDAKTLCRVFKAVMGTTAGAYRKKNS